MLRGNSRVTACFVVKSLWVSTVCEEYKPAFLQVSGGVCIVLNKELTKRSSLFAAVNFLQYVAVLEIGQQHPPETVVIRKQDLCWRNRIRVRTKVAYSLCGFFFLRTYHLELHLCHIRHYLVGLYST
uniref:Uncharacterized protein n=1 Tax=Ixodes ricinus TaxID=34613 RepID=A0A6B0UQ59_IXORI